jgi:hypothetical protein
MSRNFDDGVIKFPGCNNAFKCLQMFIYVINISLGCIYVSQGFS